MTDAQPVKTPYKWWFVIAGLIIGYFAGQVVTANKMQALDTQINEGNAKMVQQLMDEVSACRGSAQRR